jgi:signal transduction histidine kinase
VVLLVCWRIVGTALCGWLGVALLDLGLLRLVLGGVTVVEVVPVSGLEPLEWLVVSITAGWFVWKALCTPEVNAVFSPSKALSGLAGASLIALGGLNLLAVHGALPNSLASENGQMAAQSLTAAVWLGLGVTAGKRLWTGRAFPSWMVAVLGLLGLASLISATCPNDGSWALVTALLMLMALALALSAGIVQVQELLSRQDHSQLSMYLDLNGVRQQMRSDSEALEERLHDLRNAVSAVRTADSTLRRYAGSLDESSQTALAEALTSELSRLQVLIEPGRSMVTSDFDLAATLGPLVDIERGHGTDVALATDGVRAHGNAEELAQVVQNLLVNARLYAPKCSVSIMAQSFTGRVELWVSDSGQGIAEDERLSVFARASRGSSSAGTVGDGLGLFVAARLMADMGGSIRLASGHERGACFVLELPAVVDETPGSHTSAAEHRELQPMSR